jgi:hypothetical protein
MAAWKHGVLSRTANRKPRLALSVLAPSANSAHHCYHLARFMEAIGIEVNSFARVFEYGNLCRITRPWAIPFGASSAGGGFILSTSNGDGYAFGVTLCVTGGIADSDTTVPAANSYIVNVHWKRP